MWKTACKPSNQIRNANRSKTAMSNVNQFSITTLSTIPASLIYIALSPLNPLRTHLQRRVLLLVFVRQSLNEATWSAPDCVDEEAHGGSTLITYRWQKGI